MSGIFKCKNCGNIIDLSSAKNGIIECDHCFSKFTVPKKETGTVALRFLSIGEHDLDACKFDDAYAAYDKAKLYNAKEPEAYWGMALAEFKVQYIKDTVNNKLQPICHEFINKQFKLNKNYIKALEYASESQKVEYVKKAGEIDHIRSEFVKLKQSGLDYDSFICVKVSKIDDQTDGSKKNRTEDADAADQIYDLLKRHGYTPFFSEREIRGRIGVDYEAMILYALYTSETMLVVCRNEEYLQTPWVKNEYIRFKELINNKEKENDSLTIVYHGKPIERLPGFNGKIQGIDYSRREADLEIVKFVDTHTPIAKAKKEEEKKKKNEEAELFRQQLEEQKRIQKEIEEKLKNLNSNAASGANSNVVNLLIRATQEMEAKNFEKAKNFLETALERAPENGSAWWNLFLCEFECLSEKNILSQLSDANIEKISNSQNFKNAKRYANGMLKDKINGFREEIKSTVSKNKTELETEIKKLEKVKSENEEAKNQFESECEDTESHLRKLISDTDVKNSIYEHAIFDGHKRKKLKGKWLVLIWIIVAIIVIVSGVLILRADYLQFLKDYSDVYVNGAWNANSDRYEEAAERRDSFPVIAESLYIIGPAIAATVVLLIYIADSIRLKKHKNDISNLQANYDETKKVIEEYKGSLNDIKQKRADFLKDINPKISAMEKKLSVLSRRKGIMDNCLNDL